MTIFIVLLHMWYVAWRPRVSMGVGIINALLTVPGVLLKEVGSHSIGENVTVVAVTGSC